MFLVTNTQVVAKNRLVKDVLLNRDRCFARFPDAFFAAMALKKTCIYFFCSLCIAILAAARRATGIRNGLQLT